MSAPELSWALRQTQRAQADVDHRLMQLMGLRPTDYQALGHVMTATDPLGPAELSTRLAISTGSSTELVDRMEAAGHLERHPHPTDRRRRILAASPGTVGRVISELSPLFRDLDALAETFEPAEQEVIARYLRHAAQTMTDFARHGGATEGAQRASP